MEIKSVLPAMALPGGLVCLEVDGVLDPSRVSVRFGSVEAEVIGASPSRLVVRIGPSSSGDLRLSEGASEAGSRVEVGRTVAQELHSVANPVVDSLGNVYVTYSGTRGEQVPFSIFVIRPDGRRESFLGDIVNPTSMIIGPDNCLYISSRHAGTVYRSTFDKRVEKYVEGLGLATGLAFDSQGNLIVGDRSGIVYRISKDRESSVLCELEPSVSAYHLCIDQEDNLYLSGPTLATQDCIYQITPEGDSRVFYKGLGRPQGLGFGPDGGLMVAASWRGKKGLFRFRNGQPEHLVAGPMLVGFAFSADEDKLYLVDHSNLYLLNYA